MKTIKLHALMTFVSVFNLSCATSQKAHVKESDEINKTTSAEASAQKSPDRMPTCPLTELPQKMRLVKDRDPNTFQLVYYVLDENHKRVALIKDSQFGNQSFEIRTLSGELIANADFSKTGVETSIALKDCNGRVLGYVRRDIEDSFLTADASYEIKNLEENILFKSKREQENLQVFSVRNASDSEMAFFRIERNNQRYEADIESEVGDLNKFLILATLRAYASH